MYWQVCPTYALDDCAHEGGEDELCEEHHGADNGNIRPDAPDLSTDDVPNVVLHLLGALLAAGLVGPNRGEEAPNLFEEPGVFTVNSVRLMIVSHLANVYILHNIIILTFTNV